MLYKNVFNISLQRSARLQFNQGREVSGKDELQFGDLVFFNTRKRVKPGHVGLYIGENLFAHASSAKGVTISSIDYDYYSRRFMGARRFDKNGLTEKTQ
jgi:cell wall-associated NlpC family hydrolase